MSARAWIRGGLVALSVLVAGPAAAQAAEVAGVDAVFARWDTDHNGVLSLKEFNAGWEAQAKVAREAAMEKVQAGLRGQFDALDANDNAAIDPDEYDGLALVRRAGEAAPPLSGFDGNGDGRLQFQEYLAAVRQLAAATREGTP